MAVQVPSPPWFLIQWLWFTHLLLFLPHSNAFSLAPLVPSEGLTFRHELHLTSSQISLPSGLDSFYDASLSNETFQERYNNYLPEWLIENCEANEWIYPTRIQQRALDCILGMDQASTPNSIIVQAQTGTGKTLAYLLPLLASVQDRAATQAMIVVPTRELGLQVAAVAKRLVSPRRFLVMSLLQGSTLRRQRAWAWAETPHIVIGTPTELLDMVRYGGLPRVNSIQTVVVDEVDACLGHSSGLAPSGRKQPVTPDLQELLSKYLCPTHADKYDAAEQDGELSSLMGGNRQTIVGQAKPQRRIGHRKTIFASATIPQHRHFIKQCAANQWTLEDPVWIGSQSGQSPLPPTLQHAYLVCATTRDQFMTLRRRILKRLVPDSNTPTKSRRILIFCDPSQPLEEMAQTIMDDLHGIYHHGPHTLDIPDTQIPPVISVLRWEYSLSHRASAVEAFSSMLGGPRVQILLTTDLAARGLDMVGVTHVVHYDMPLTADVYLHRSGRTGRLGQIGQVISIVTAQQEFALQRHANALSLEEMKCIGRQQSKTPKAKSR